MIDHRSFTCNSSSYEIEAWTKIKPANHDVMVNDLITISTVKTVFPLDPSSCILNMSQECQNIPKFVSKALKNLWVQKLLSPGQMDQQVVASRRK